jgi:PAS domain-containing protein
MMRGDFVKGRNHTVSLLYEAAMNPSLWPNALAAFADLTQCRDVVLSVIDKKRGKPRLFLSGCRIFTPEAMRDYLTHYYKVDPLLQSSASTSPAGTLLLCHEFVSPDVAARNESYQDYLIPHGGRYMGGWCLENNEEVLAGFTMQARDAPFERKKVARWGSMAQHARHAVALSLQLAEHMSQIVMMRQAIDSAGVVCIMVDGDSKLIDCSAAAAALLGHGVRNGNQAIASVGDVGSHWWWRRTHAYCKRCRRKLLHHSGRARRRVNGQSFRSPLCRVRLDFRAAAFGNAPGRCSTNSRSLGLHAGRGGGCRGFGRREFTNSNLSR